MLRLGWLQLSSFQEILESFNSQITVTGSTKSFLLCFSLYLTPGGLSTSDRGQESPVSVGMTITTHTAKVWDTGLHTGRAGGAIPARAPAPLKKWEKDLNTHFQAQTVEPLLASITHRSTNNTLFWTSSLCICTCLPLIYTASDQESHQTLPRTYLFLFLPFIAWNLHLLLCRCVCASLPIPWHLSPAVMMLRTICKGSHTNISFPLLPLRYNPSSPCSSPRLQQF